MSGRRCIIPAVLVWLIVAAIPGGVEITVTDPDPPCAWERVLRTSIDRLPRSTDSSPHPVSVRIVAARDTLHIEFRDAHGAASSRTLPATPPCEARADGVALVIERELSALGYQVADPPPQTPPISTEALRGWTRPVRRTVAGPTETATAAASATSEKAPAETSAVASASGSAHRSTTSTTTSPAEGLTERPPWSLRVGVTGVVETVGAERPRWGGGLEVAVGRGRYAGVLTTVVVAPASIEIETDSVQRGTLSVGSAIGSAGPEVCFDLRIGRACGLVQAGVEVSWASAEGDTLFRLRDSQQARFVGAFGARYRPHNTPFDGQIFVEALWRPNAPVFVVEGGARYEDGPVALRFGMAAFFNFF